MISKFKVRFFTAMYVNQIESVEFITDSHGQTFLSIVWCDGYFYKISCRFKKKRGRGEEEEDERNLFQLFRCGSRITRNSYSAQSRRVIRALCALLLKKLRKEKTEKQNRLIGLVNPPTLCALGCCRSVRWIIQAIRFILANPNRWKWLPLI